MKNTSLPLRWKMRIRATLPWLFLCMTLLLAGQIQAQSRLSDWGADTAVFGWVGEILEVTEQEADFYLQKADTGAVRPALVDGQRIIFINPRYLDTLPADVLRLAVLSHAIGHHLNEHRFIRALADDERLEAAEYTGYVLYTLGAQRALLARLPDFLPELAPPDPSEWVAALERGFDRAEAALLAVPHSSYQDDGSGDALAGVPEFPFPPAPASASYDLTDLFGDCQRLRDIDARLFQALDVRGYYSCRYFHVKGGFALVTRIEQFNPDGTCLHNNDARWSARAERQETFSLDSFLGYFKKLFTNDDRYFRVFAFIVTDQAWTADRQRTVSWEEAHGWMDEVSNRLPREIGRREVDDDTKVTVLIYEFRKKESNGDDFLTKPSELPGRTHLQRSQLLDQISRK